MEVLLFIMVTVLWLADEDERDLINRTWMGCNFPAAVADSSKYKTKAQQAGTLVTYEITFVPGFILRLFVAKRSLLLLPQCFGRVLT